MKIIVTFLTAILSMQLIAQETPTLYQDDYVKVSFKKIDGKYAYLLEDYNSMFGGILVEYKIENNEFSINELDTIIIIDSIAFYKQDNYKKDSVMLSTRFRINEFANAGMSYNHLKYFINGSLIYDGTKMYKDDDMHRVLIPQFQKPYELIIEAGYDTIGPFIINTKNDVVIKLIVLKSSLTFEFDYGKNLPNKIDFEGKTYKLKHNFIEWD
jgi:hypothetical protein